MPGASREASPAASGPALALWVSAMPQVPSTLSCGARGSWPGCLPVHSAACRDARDELSPRPVPPARASSPARHAPLRVGKSALRRLTACFCAHSPAMVQERRGQIQVGRFLCLYPPPHARHIRVPLDPLRCAPPKFEHTPPRVRGTRPKFPPRKAAACSPPPGLTPDRASPTPFARPLAPRPLEFCRSTPSGTKDDS